MDAIFVSTAERKTMHPRDPVYQALFQKADQLRKLLTATQRELAAAEKALREYWKKHRSDDQLPLR